MVADHTAPEIDRSVLVLIDVQNDFVSGAAVVDGTAEHRRHGAIGRDVPCG
jgi:nicotinamidase-related amidase